MDSVGECEGLSIQREAHHQPLPVRPEAHPVLQAVVGIEVLTGVSFRHVERRQVTRLAVSVVLLGLTAAVRSRHGQCEVQPCSPPASTWGTPSPGPDR